jgi:hypothetical protein
VPTGTIILFDDRDLKGSSLVLENEDYVPNLKANGFNDKVSSFIIVSGVWRFYRDSDKRTPFLQDLGPGVYRWVEDVGIKNDKLSSLECLK